MGKYASDSEYHKTYHKSGDDRRAMKRTGITLPVKVEILIPEETFNPTTLEGNAVNISSSGMKFTIYEIDNEFYKKIIANQRHVNTLIEIPDAEDELKLKGKTVWVEYHPNAKPRGFCSMGVYFEDVSLEQKSVLRNLLDKASQSQEPSAE